MECTLGNLVLISRSLGTKQQELIHLNFANIFFVALLISIAPVDQLTFNCNFFSFIKVFFGNFGHLTPGYYPVPLCFSHFFSLCVSIAFMSRHVELGKFFTVFCVFYFWLCSQITNK